MGKKTVEKVAGVYHIYSVKETETGVKLNPDGTFRFFFTYGALDRYGSGLWTLDGDWVTLQSQPWSGKDFTMVTSSASGRGITVKIIDTNPVFQKHIFASLQNGKEGTWQGVDARGEIHFPVTDAGVITLAFEFSPERFTFFPLTNKEHNYFEFRLEPWVMEVFFNKFPLRIHKYMLLGKHPLLRGEEFIYEKG